MFDINITVRFYNEIKGGDYNQCEVKRVGIDKAEAIDVFHEVVDQLCRFREEL